MKNKIMYLSKNIFLFTISNFIPKILSFLLIGLYTKYLSTSDYGVSDLINTTVSLLIPLLTLDIQDAVLRYSMDNKYNKYEVLKSGLVINIKSLVILTFACTILNLLNLLNINTYIYFFIIIYFIFGSLQNVFIIFCKSIDKVKSIVIASVLSSIITIAANILLVAVLKFGLIGFLISNVIGTIIYDVYLFIDAGVYESIKIAHNKKLSKELIKYSWPLVFNSISWWVNNASDRYILTFISGISLSGIYAISYKIPGILSSFQSIFYQAWSITAIKEFDKKDSDGFIGKMYTFMNFCMVFLCSIIMLLNIPIASILYANDFFAAWKYVPPLLVSVVFNSMCLFIGGILTAVKDTKAISLSTIIGAVVNTILNIILISFFNAYGAAIATLIGYLVVLLIRTKNLKKHIKMKTNNKINFMSYFLIIVQLILCYYENKFILIQIIVLILIVLLYLKNIIETISVLIKKLKIK